jgi:hypothetical protein
MIFPKYNDIDQILKDNSGSGSSITSGSGSSKTKEDDPCAPSGDASQLCKDFMKAENDGNYTGHTGSYYGAYQISDDEFEATKKASGVSRADWDRCKQSASADCKSVQDRVCNAVTEKNLRYLKKLGLPQNLLYLYLVHNQGPGGARDIYKALKAGKNEVDNIHYSDGTTLWGDMKGQAWVLRMQSSKYANYTGNWKNPRDFIRNMRQYLIDKGASNPGSI